jgi:hypothetical protein
MVTTSVYCSPLILAPSKYVSVNFVLRSCEVELADGLYALCPEQDVPHFVEGTKRSLLPVSKSTVYNTGSDGRFIIRILYGHTSKIHSRCPEGNGTTPHARVVVVG